MFPDLDRRLLKVVQKSSDLSLVNKAKARLVDRHKGLVYSIANKYFSNRNEKADLVQEGMIGLLEAIKRFDTERDIRFSTYASFWIRAKILPAVAPINDARKYWRFRKGELKGTEQEQEILAEICPTVNLDDLEPVLYDRSSRSAEARITEYQDSVKFKQAFSKLPEQDKTILSRRFGEVPQTLKDIGRQIGKSRERVRQLEGVALEHLRQQLERVRDT